MRWLWTTLFLLTLAQSSLGDDLEKARAALDKGRGDLALRYLEGEGVPTRVSRLEALCSSEEYTQARELLRKLEREKHGAFPPPYDFRFYLFRGEVEEADHNHKLAEKNYHEALRRAQTTDQRLKVRKRESTMWLDLEEPEKAAAAFSKTRVLSQVSQDTSLIASVLALNARFQYERGEAAGASVSNRAARELYLSLSQRSNAAWALYQSLLYGGFAGDELRRLDITEQAISEFIAAEDYSSAVRLLNGVRFLFFSLANSDAGDRIEPLFLEVMAKIPPGPEKEQAQLIWAFFQLDTDSESNLADEIFRGLTRSESREVRCMAHQGLAQYHSENGDRQKALEELGKALELATPQVKTDADWRVSPGAILLRMSYQEKARRNYREALRLAHLGMQKEPGASWAYWRVESRYDTLMAAVENFDRKAAEEEFAAALKEIEDLPKVSQRSGVFTTILASLLLNQSVEADVLDPAVLLLGEYPESTQDLLRKGLAEARGLDVYLAEFDHWHQQILQKKEASIQPYPLLYKGLILEAVGRNREARGALESAVSLAERLEVKPAQMLGHVLLARVCLAEGETEDGVRHMTEAARVSETLNPVAARFYLLVAGSAQREHGELSQALATFDKVVELLPNRAWPGWYGRALTLEEMGRFEEALLDTEKALEQVADSERTHSVAELRALKARLLNKLEQPEKAVSLYSRAHQELLYSATLPKVTREYGELLVSQDRAPEALTLFTDSLDHISSLSLKLDSDQRDLFERTVALALELEQNDTALKYLQLSRSAELLDSVDLSQVSAEDDQTRKLLQELDQLKRRLASLREESGKVGDSSTRESIGQQLAATRGEFFSKLNELRSREPDFEALVQISGSQLAAIQKLLPERTALIEFFPAQSTLYVFLVTAESFSLHEVSLSRQELTLMVERLLELCTDPNSSERELQTVLRTLYDPLIGVAEKQLSSIDSLMLVPSGALWEVPFAALEDDRGRALADEYEVSYLGSSELLKILQRRGSQKALTPALLVQGAEELRGARAEIEGLARLLGDARVLTPDVIDVPTFRELVKGRRLLHLASHSVVSRHAGESYVQMGDGRLTLEDIYGLELEPSSMVVLSSCRSGVGVAVPGKEVTSLATAFSVAGASSVIASRWPVDDQSTARFFELYYREMLDGKSRGQALRAAQTRMAAEKPHPYYWAAFSLLGDPR